MNKYILIIIAIVSLSSCKNDKVSFSDFEKFSFLNGDWERVNDQKGQKTYESWYPTNDGKWIGTGYTLQDKDTVFKEELLISRSSNSWNLTVTGVNNDATIFEINERSNNSFTAVNPKNEFPKMIKYSKIGDQLKAIIIADSMEIAFDFKRR